MAKKSNRAVARLRERREENGLPGTDSENGEYLELHGSRSESIEGFPSRVRISRADTIVTLILTEYLVKGGANHYSAPLSGDYRPSTAWHHSHRIELVNSLPPSAHSLVAVPKIPRSIDSSCSAMFQSNETATDAVELIDNGRELLSV